MAWVPRHAVEGAARCAQVLAGRLGTGRRRASVEGQDSVRRSMYVGIERLVTRLVPGMGTSSPRVSSQATVT